MSNRFHRRTADHRRSADHRRTGRLTRLSLSAALIAVPSLGAAPAAEAVARAPISRAATGGRVDTVVPTFSHPTRITNPLFPITTTRHMVGLGEEGTTRLRHETTLLDRTRTIRWNGQDVEVIVSQFVAYGDERIIEIAIDYFAQGDDGAVWYFGEDVTNYEDGQIKDHNGTWLAGKDGPPGMIMPAHPKVGDIYRPENIPGVVFEETTVKAVGLTVSGPSGAVSGAIRVEEHPMNADVETKVYAPGYGEFEATVPASSEHLVSAVAVPTDIKRVSEPDALDALSDAARDALDGAKSDRWSKLRAGAAEVGGAWDGARRDGVPAVLETAMTRSVKDLRNAAAARDRSAYAQAALDIEFAAMDIELQYTDRAEVDHDRLESWKRQKQLDQAAGDAAGVASDRIIIAAIKARPQR